MKQVSIKIDFDLKDDIPDEDIVEWVEFTTGQIGGIRTANRLFLFNANDLEDTMNAYFKLHINGRQIK